MDGENNGKPYFEKVDDLAVPLFLETPIKEICNSSQLHIVRQGYRGPPKHFPYEGLLHPSL